MWNKLPMLPTDGLGGGGSGDAGAGGAPSGGDSGGGAASGESGARQGPGPGATNVGGEAGPSDDDGLSGGGGDAKAADPNKPVAPKYKARRGGKDAEFTGAELAKMLSDDHEEEFRGPGGKPLKLKRADIERRVQQSEGWEARMREANELKQKYESKRDIAKGTPEQLEAYLESELGMNVEQFVMGRVKQMRDRDKKLTHLNSPLVQGQDGKWYQNGEYNPNEYNRLVSEQAQAKFDRKQKLDQAVREASEATERTTRETADRTSRLGAALKEGNVAVNDATMKIAETVLQEHIQLNVQLTAADLQRQVGQRYRESILGELQKMDDAGLREFFGPDFRARLRKLEVDTAKGAKKEEQIQQRAAGGAGNGVKPKVVSEAGFDRMFSQSRGR